MNMNMNISTVCHCFCHNWQMADVNVAYLKNANITFLILYSITSPKMYSFKNLQKLPTKLKIYR